MNCPLCSHSTPQHYHTDKKRDYLHCVKCDLVFVPSQYHLSVEEEKAEYDLHQNGELTAGYRRFLNRTLHPVLDKIKRDNIRQPKGLDFGCGEGRALCQMAKEQGVPMDNYDLFYHPDNSVFKKQYHFITMTEVLEHLVNPLAQLKRLHALLLADGFLAIMTKRVSDKLAFSKWHYKNDPTHICFYSEQTFSWIGETLGFESQTVDDDVVLLNKRSSFTKEHD